MASARQLLAYRERLAFERAEQEEQERPLREAEARLAATASELAKLERERITSGKDELWVDPSLTPMSKEAAMRFFGESFKAFVESSPWFYYSESNRDTLLSYMERNGLGSTVQIVNSTMFEKAARKLADYGLLEDRPEPVEPEPEPIEEQIQREPEMVPGWDWATGKAREYSHIELNRMSAKDFARAMRIPRSGLVETVSL
jgi:hypothetical protein